MYLQTIHNELRVSHRVIAEATQNKVISIQNLITSNIKDFKEFGLLHFENEAIKNSKNKINQQKTYYLNEQQATLLFTYLRNSKIVKEFKIKLVKEFYVLKAELKAIKTNEYVNKIANLKAINLKAGKHLQNVRNGYLSQISQKNKKIKKLENELKNGKVKVVYKKEPYKVRTQLEKDFLKNIITFKKCLNTRAKKLFDEMAEQDLNLHFTKFMHSLLTDVSKTKATANKDEYFQKRLETIKNNTKYTTMWVNAHINNKF